MVLAGEMDIATGPELDRVMRGLPEDAGVVVLDLSELEFMDSTGLHLVLEVNDRIRDAGGRLLVVHGSAVRRLFAVSGIASQLELADQPPAVPASTRSRSAAA